MLIATVEMVRVRGLIEGSACAPTDIVHARASGMMINIIEQLDEHEQRLVVPYGSLATYTGRRGGRGWDVLMLHPDLIAIMMVDTRRLHGSVVRGYFASVPWQPQPRHDGLRFSEYLPLHPNLCWPCLTQSPPQSLLAVGYTLTRLNHVLSRLQSDPEGLTRYVQALEARAAGPEANLAAQFAAVLARLRAAACAAA